MNTKNQIISTLIIFMIIGCAANYYNPYNEITRDQFYKEINTIALRPMEIYTDVSNEDSLKNVFEILLTKELERVGFKVIHSNVFADIWNPLEDSLGGIFDSKTGKKDTSKYNNIYGICSKKLKSDYSVDAILYYDVRKVKARWSGSTASWNGVKDNMKSTGTAVLEALGGISSSGTVPALSIVVIIRDMNNTLLYSKYGGVQVLTKRGGFPKKWNPVPQTEILMDEGKNIKAINIALEEILTIVEP